jgi:peptidoglycan hydrolase-like protein with peptidoglycan-binding domain
MGRALWIPEALSRAGLQVDYVAGWENRGNESGFNPRGHVNHHTAGGPNGTQPSLGICTNGRSDLAGPLCNIFLPREESRRVIVVASGKANHAGKGGWKGLNSNYQVTGVEVEHTGTSAQGVSPLRYDNMVRIAAAMCWGGKFGVDMVCQHREWAPGRKPDFTASGIPDTDLFRRQVQAVLNEMGGGVSPAPGPPPPPPGAVILKRGAKGNAVRHVQERLNAHSINDGRLHGSVDGDFGPNTEQRVKAFQQDVHLGQDGIVGPQTLHALDTEPNRPAPVARPVIKRGSKGEHVRYLQERLNAHSVNDGRLKGSVDGDFGPNTEKRVKAFQQDTGLRQDGAVGPATWAKLG